MFYVIIKYNILRGEKMFNRDIVIDEETKQKFRQYVFIDALDCLSVFEALREKDYFYLDKKTEDIFVDLTKLFKMEYKNKTLDSIDDNDIDSVFKLVKNTNEKFEALIPNMTKKELNNLEKFSIELGANIIRKLEDYINEEEINNEIAINNLSNEIFYWADSKKKQDELIRIQDELIAKSDQVSVENARKRNRVLRISYVNSHKAFLSPIKPLHSKIKDFVESQTKTKAKAETSKGRELWKQFFT